VRTIFAVFIVTLLAVVSLPARSTAGARSRKQTSAKAPVLSAQAAQRAGLSAQELIEATKLYTTKCMRCHKSYEPRIYDQIQWESWMGKMRKKAHLTPEQETLLGRYLGACRSESLVAKTNTPAQRQE
jgi:cytochrome c5